MPRCHFCHVYNRWMRLVWLKNGYRRFVCWKCLIKFKDEILYIWNNLRREWIPVNAKGENA